uniref:ATP synthase complex subunit 8 n=4 Tax=Rhadinocentrus ornatus TaxID=262101 RepID=Q6SR42_RHAOR|nr:ATPase 8 [Rhadinocentrus ornatus]AAS49220.1 ATPase 8 [Rhadinocentrus ornatus]AAS49222.1 ATPase 8 [Rhadinocentrus ornatus]AAS49224.1 ATPase 8 [Rhadinocentrus ornatus]AAS49226.1 ATPase 8 [Rhadinocentrus ornatus]
MPQLKVKPWFPILALIWFIFLTILPRKVLAYSYPNRFSPQTPGDLVSSPWTWWWH